jgi:hypothetical protein
MLVQACATRCWVVGSSTTAVAELSLSARRDSERASHSSAVTTFVDDTALYVRDAGRPGHPMVYLNGAYATSRTGGASSLTSAATTGRHLGHAAGRCTARVSGRAFWDTASSGGLP